MKKVFFIIILVIAFVSISQKSFAIPNPWINCNDDISCGAKQAGFNFPLRIKNYSVRAMKDMFEISFPLDKKRSVTVRKSQAFDGVADSNGIVDISGVYNNYSVNQTIRLKSGIPFSVRGEKKKFYVSSFAADTGYYSFYCEKGLKKKDLEYFYKLLEEAEAPRHSFDETENYTIEQLQDMRRVDGIVEPVFTQDVIPQILLKKGVTEKCFERANLGQDSFCSASEIKMIKDYYKK